MRLAVMQPYLFPYIGYFQLIYAADFFLIYDDVAYIKQGYINRNNIFSPNGKTRFTVPVPGASSNKLISELGFSKDVDKVIKTIEQSYSKAPYFEEVFPIIRQILKLEDRSIASVCQKSFEDIFLYLGIKKHLKRTSELVYDRSSDACSRLIDLCKHFGARCYINSPGGRDLYTAQAFTEHGIALRFIDTLSIAYDQGKDEFTPNLSIIDVLMHCPPEQVVDLLGHYELADS